MFNFLKPVHQIYSIAVDPLSVDLDKFEEFFNKTKKAVMKTSRIVARTVTSATFSELLRVESIRNIVHTHFHPEEIAKLSEGVKKGYGK